MLRDTTSKKIFNALCSSVLEYIVADNETLFECRSLCVAKECLKFYFIKQKLSLPSY